MNNDILKAVIVYICVLLGWKVIMLDKNTIELSKQKDEAFNLDDLLNSINDRVNKLIRL